jgi:hypothetical protein
MDPDNLRLNLLPAEKATVTPRGIRFHGVFYSCERAVREQWFSRARVKGDWREDVVFDPRITDFIYLKPPGALRFETCTLVKAEQRFQGRAWAEVVEVSEIQKEQKELAATDDRQAEAAYRVKAEGIVTVATEQTAAVQNSQSKRSRLAGIRKNWEIERASERHTNATRPSDVDDGRAEKIVNLPSVKSEDDGDSASLKMLDKLKKQTEQQRKHEIPSF